jgi:DNA-binding transcriptional MerR regulator
MHAQFRVNTLGQAGIGTSPQNRLDVAGNARVSGSIYLGSDTSSVGTAGDFPLIFKVNNSFAGFTGNRGNSNVSFGYGALPNPYSGGSYDPRYYFFTENTAIGAGALYGNTGGYYNTAIGAGALSYNTTGYQNIAIGRGALLSNSTGYDNIAIGMEALRNSSASNNIAIGTEALWHNSTGYSNVAIGNKAMCYNRLGRYNTAIGHWTDNGYDLNNTTTIGNGAYVSADNQIRLGNYTVNSIGGYANWTMASDGRAKKNINANIPGLEFINRLQPVSYNFDLKAIDELMKSDDPKINAFHDSLQAAMSPEERKITEEARANKEKTVYSGFIAQDVEKAAKETGYDFSGVDAPENGKGTYGLRYAEFVVPLVKAVQELSEQNKRLQEQNNSLQKQINELTGKAASPEILKSKGEAAGLSEAATAGALLEQNIPNPFNQNTVIKYYLPQSVTAAQLCIYDLNGKQLKQIRLTERGSGSQTISASEFQAGIYLYALIADGQEVDVKRMILTE